MERLEQERVKISFWCYERGLWRRADRLTDPAEVQCVAQKYVWKDWSLYDRGGWQISPAQCIEAARVDGTNAVYLVSREEQEKQAAEGRHIMDKELLTSVPMALDEEIPNEEEPQRPKRRRANMPSP